MDPHSPRPVQPLRALLWKHHRHAANIGRLLKTQSVFKIVFILTFATLFEAGLALMFYQGFHFLKSLLRYAKAFYLLQVQKRRHIILANGKFQFIAQVIRIMTEPDHVPAIFCF